LALTSPASGGRLVSIVRACGLKPQSIFLTLQLFNQKILGVFHVICKKSKEQIKIYSVCFYEDFDI
jgi:hypothetical protein